MIGRMIRIAANEFLRRRAVRAGGGLRRLPPTSMREAQLRALNHVVRGVFKRISKR
jgi:hypothetical protein